MKHHHTLLLGRLHRHEAHRRPGHRLADGLGIGGIVFLPLQIRLHVLCRQQPHIMASCDQLSRPIVGGAAGLDPDEASGQILEEPKHSPSGQFPPNDNRARGIHTVHLKDRLRDIQTNRRNVDHLSSPTPLAPRL
ncbi:conserved protein of unknown function [Aminobacter niigataensis]|nr:conserved protein of unknown function [Aminobacter niigataensis]